VTTFRPEEHRLLPLSHLQSDEVQQAAGLSELAAFWVSSNPVAELAELK
jgi:hypothetical protein